MPSISKPNTNYLLLLFLILMTLTSCEEDTLEDVDKQSQELERIDFTIANSEHLYENDKNLKEVVQKLKTNAQKAISSSIYNFGIYESSAQVYEAPNYTQYTFEVYRDTTLNGQLENYVLLIYHDNSIEQYLVKYNINTDNTFEFYDIQSINDPNLDMTKSSCTPELIEQQDFTTCTSYPCGGLGHVVGEECECGEPDAWCTDRAYVECVDGTVYVFEDPCGGQSTDGNPTTPDPSSPQEPTSSTGPGSNTNEPSDPSDETFIIKGYKKVSQCTKDAINNLPQDQADWINSLNNCEIIGLGETSTCNRNLYEDIASFINSNSNDCEMSVEDELLLEEFKEIIETVPNAKIERLKELKDLIEEDPWALIQDCAQQNGLNTQDYLDLYNLPFPQECTDRLNGNIYLGPHQPIIDGNVPLANIDYYGVEITQMPDTNGDNLPDSNAELYQAFRNSFTNLASGNKDDFQFSCDVPFNSTDTGEIIWNFEPFLPQDQLDFVSDNPIISVLLIEASANINGNVFDNIPTDEGAIIFSNFTPNDWTISTIRTTSNGSQPFSGNRQWGWITNEAGNTELFTRAVDVARINKFLSLAPGTDTECQQDTYYDIADATWVNLQNELEQWILDNGGQASIKQPIAAKVDKDKIVELLTSEQTIDQINCD